ncbi:ABC transporter permease subunit [Streptomyces sp. WAC 06725]|uniref:ABC transporter permease subunit n=1 Tax=Streptomyces sp. WAC 06725 TaxID=2203209 RepID=UPI000F736CBA|nr:ABC transporter permease subunit [Streptomyces sp. WAC 06725]
MNNAMRSEWIKLISLRSYLWSLPSYFVVCLAVGSLMGYTSRRVDNLDPTALGFSGLQSGMLLMVVLGIMAVTNEYSSGTIQTSLLAVPRRITFYTAKLGTLMLVTVVLSAVAAPGGFFLVQGILGDSGISVDATVLARMAGAVAYTTLLVGFSMGVAMVLRSSTMTLSLLLPVFFMLSTILTNIPATRKVAQFLPDMAGSLVLRQDLAPDSSLNAVTGLAVLAAWAGVAATAGYVSLARRDA